MKWQRLLAAAAAAAAAARRQCFRAHGPRASCDLAGGFEALRAANTIDTSKTPAAAYAGRKVSLHAEDDATQTIGRVRLVPPVLVVVLAVKFFFFTLTPFLLRPGEGVETGPQPLDRARLR
ncbi:hypothetical protein JDV02_010135 [Purpureocillium takamizusanense]|uniref:Uncharacterized protein n=1 Tax=Purpureocillium takamizusanense TaxID=2060973 RepID=A0A9Q8QR81_9HYPO|nr:uncharacterized protein JDV02_010135 [Purpureocillium takamizusanense]UNI24385.1 hypothetical protein JDV02_010135 [Purpureocillium takamizusanense]